MYLRNLHVIYLFQAKELDANTDYYIELLAKGIGKPKEEISKDIQRPKYFQAQDAIAYGIADKIIDSRDAAFEKRVKTLEVSSAHIKCLSFVSSDWISHINILSRTTMRC